MNPTNNPPKDGERVLVWHGGWWLIATYQAQGWSQHWRVSHGEYLLDQCVAGWQPLPPGPDQTASTESKVTND